MQAGGVRGIAGGQTRFFFWFQNAISHFHGKNEFFLSNSRLVLRCQKGYIEWGLSQKGHAVLIPDGKGWTKRVAGALGSFWPVLTCQSYFSKENEAKKTVNPGLLLTAFLVTLSEPDRMAGLRKLESPSLVPNQHRTSQMGVGGRARRHCRASYLQRAAWG